ncbi:MAG TPA: hypothetical protein VGR26_10105, partial [Acidimicrobiales bacterium]|nr:hypothetical protein [Acidimicrobiales bacterium]
AGATSCTCRQCGTECKGRFAGCVDVWARGPREVAVRASSFRLPSKAVPPAVGISSDIPGAGSGATGEAGLGRRDDGLRLLLDELISRCEAVEAVDSKVDSLAEAQAALETSFEADAETGRHLEQLSSRLAQLEQRPSPLAALEQLSSRLEALEAASPADPAPVQQELTALVDRIAALESTPSHEAHVPAGLGDRVERLADEVAALASAPPAEPRVPPALVKQMELLAGQVAASDGTTKRLAALEGVPDRLVTLEQSVAALEPSVPGAGPGHDLDGVTAHLARLTSEVASLRAVPKRVEAIEKVQGRVNAIDKSLATLSRDMSGLSEKVATAPTATLDPETTQRIDTLDGSLGELVQTVGQLSSQVAGFDEVPKRVEALEQTSSPLEKQVASMGKRIDRLSTQAASVKELPGRVEALEQSASDDRRLDQLTERVEEIAGGLGALRSTLEALVPRLHALGQLSPRIQALEEATAAAEVPDHSDRSEVLARGLGHAIDMIDQLAHQVAVLERSNPVSENATA